MASSSTPYTFPAPNNNNINKREAIESVDNLRNETTGKEAKSARIIKEEEKDIEEEVEKNEEEEVTGEQKINNEEASQPSTSWLGTHRHLQAAVAAIDDRLLFLRICEELDARGIRYESVSTESYVGGYLLKLMDMSSVTNKFNVDAGDFFENLKECNIRLNLPDGSSQLECTFINPPLVQDFDRTEEEVEADKQKPHTWVLTIGSQRPRDMPSQSCVIAHNIEDRLLTYCHIYTPVKRFEEAYNSFYKNYCSVRAFTYHKLVLAYGGEHRDLLFILSWRWNWRTKTGNYALCFGQAPSTNKQNGHVPQRRWNPHVLVSQLLIERFKKERDLVWLVNYLVNSHRSLSIIHQFVKTQIRSTKINSQILGTEANFPAEMMFHLTPVDEYCIRLSYGSQFSMEFLLLQDNQVAVRDCSAGSSADINYGGVTLSDFWRSFQLQNGSDEEVEQVSAAAGLAAGGKIILIFIVIIFYSNLSKKILFSYFFVQFEMFLGIKNFFFLLFF
uniref:Mediator of RNA polymerase II transcription subunit 14 RM6 domain-containing protein n=1 Tax=Meloidogyne incognita TaxID=6306 RepID=A0A914L8C1_MELIC